MTTSASPFRRSASGSVVRSDGSHTTRTGQWKAPTTFFAPGRSIAVLPPIPASTWPTSVVGTADHATPRMYVAAAKPATSVVEPPPSATTLPSRPIANRPQRRSSTAGVLAGSPAGTSWRATSRAPRPTWARIPWMPETCGVGDELDGTVPGHEVAELVDRAGLDVDACGREQDAVDVARARVGDLLVEGLPLPVQRVEVVLGPGERPVRCPRRAARRSRGRRRAGR